MSFFIHSGRAAQFAASLLASALLRAPCLRAQSDSDGGLSRVSNNNPFGSAFPALNSDRHLPTPLPVFFPPEPPPLDRTARRAPVSLAARLGLGRGLGAPPELASYVNEPFYPALADRISHHDLSDRQQAALARYREEKRALQHELRTELSRTLALEPAARGPLLAELARLQDPKIADLENRAEAFRADLVKRDHAWSARREWHLGDSPNAPDSAQDIARVMRAAAYFQKGLGAAQRALLREIAIEVPAAAETAAEAVAAQPYVFFSPGPARVLFPENIPAAVGAKIAEYQTRKSALRKTLYDAVYREDSAKLNLLRSARLKSLADEQAPEFAALEMLAEEIRRDLAPLPPLPRTEPLVPLPPALAQRVIAHFQRQTAEQNQHDSQLEELRARYPLLRLVPLNAGGRRTYKVMGFGSKNFLAERDRAQRELDALAAASARVVVALAAEQDGLRRDLAEFLHAEEPSMVKVALNEGVRLAAEQSLAEIANDYRRAVFEPGLSPGQRRLLFDAVVENFDLPLPAGESQPTQRRTQRIGALSR